MVYSSTMELTDEQLVIAFREGDGQALEQLIQRYLKPVYSFLHRLSGNAQDADDISQEVFVKVWKNLGKYNVERPFRPWLFRIAKNAATDFFRKKKLVPFTDFDQEEGTNPVTDSLADLGPLPDELLASQQAGEKLMDCLQGLPLIYREVLLLRNNDHYSFLEIAEILNQPLNTVKSRHRRGLIMLRDRLTGEDLGNLPVDNSV
jgi:RNA polymerase sigma-70 factor (ECF subfamily)